MIETKDYYSKTLAMRVKGALYDFDPSQKEYATELLIGGAPKNCVVIASTVKTHVEFFIVEAHPDCMADHKFEPVWYTSITARAFPDVDSDHRRVVQSFGERLTIVRVPIIKEITVNDFVQ